MIVVDASVVVSALIYLGDAGNRARAELDADPNWWAPAVLDGEVMDVLRTLASPIGGQAKLPAAEADRAATRFAKMSFRTVRERAEIVTRVWELRANVTARDAFYVASAEMLDATLVTRDRKLSKATGPRCRFRTL